MKKTLILFLALLCAGASFAQQKVAVYVTGGNDAAINKVLGDQLVAAIVKSGKYTAIERTGNFLAELSKEQVYQRTGNVSDAEISRLGKQFGVELVCVAEVNEVFGEKYISARLINVESAEVLNTSNASGSMKSMEDLLKITEKITKELTGKTTKEQTVVNQQSKVITSNSCEELQEEKPALRAVGKGTNVREQTAKNIAEMQARAQFARAIASKIKAVTAEATLGIDFYSGDAAATEQVNVQLDFTQSVAEEIIKNTIIIKTCKELNSNNQYEVWVCLEYQGDIAKMADEIAGKVERYIPKAQKSKTEQFKKRMKAELEK